jgi:sugar/nucleoside kinase (ribokinase family)
MERVRKLTGLHELVIHTPHYAGYASDTDGVYFYAQQHIKNPVRTAAAGDTFNGCYLATQAAGVEKENRLRFANGAVRYFLRYGKAPTLPEALRESLNESTVEIR